MSYDDDEENASQDDLSDEGENDVEDNDEGDDGGDGNQEGDDDADGDGDGDEDDAEGDGEGEDDDDQEENDSPVQSRSNNRIHTGTSPKNLSNGTGDPSAATDGSFRQPSPRDPKSGIVLPYHPPMRPEAITASTYDIVPTIAAPHATSINTIAATPDMRWVFTGGTDGYIRKFNWVDSANSKLMLTVAQRHPFVDSVTKAGVLLSYWENEDESMRHPGDEGVGMSPVYSLAVQHQGLWLLSGLESGGINLQSVRHSEGTRIATLSKHTSAVSVLHLAPDERSFLSGSWDKNMHDWDLNTGQVRRTYTGSTGQISCIEMRPESSLPAPVDIEEQETTEANGTFSSNNAAPPLTNGLFGDDHLANDAMADDGLGLPDLPDMGGEGLPTADDDHDSLFGDDDATFMNGDTDAPLMPGLEADDDDEFSRAMASELQQNEDELMADVNMPDLGGPVQPPGQAPDISSNTSNNEDSTAPIQTDLSNTMDIDLPPPDLSLPDNIDTMQDLPNPATTTALDLDLPTIPNSTDDTSTLALPPAPDLANLFDDSLILPDLPTLPNPPPLSPSHHITLNTTSQTNPPTSPGPSRTFLSSEINGTIRIWDSRQPNPIAKISGKHAPPWCMSACWSPDGNFIYAGRRNNSVDEYSLHKGFREPTRQFRFPKDSGAVSAVKCMPNGRNLVCASYDILRLYDLQHDAQPASRGHSIVPFLIVPGHRTGVISQLYLDSSCTFLISTAGNRGWEGSGTETLLGYEIGIDGGQRTSG